MKTSEILRYMHRHTKQLRRSFGEPSEETKRQWDWYDTRQEFIINLYERREAAEAAEEKDAITLTTEVKIK